jgi:hypothetical protein
MGKTTLKEGHGWNDNIKMNVKDVIDGNMNWAVLSQNMS